MWFGASCGARITLGQAATWRVRQPPGRRLPDRVQVLALSLCTSQTFPDSRKDTRIPGPFRKESRGWRTRSFGPGRSLSSSRHTQSPLTNLPKYRTQFPDGHGFPSSSEVRSLVEIIGVGWEASERVRETGWVRSRYC